MRGKWWSGVRGREGSVRDMVGKEGHGGVGLEEGKRV